MNNGSNVPDDCRHSNHWDDNEILCPSCDDTMTESSDCLDLICDNDECRFFIEDYKGGGEDE